MFKKLATLALAVSLTGLLCTPAKAIDMKMNGVFKTWSISQNDFRAGKDDINDWYTVSLVRLKPTFSAFDGDVQVNLRMDLAQGWWGIDNERGGFKNLNGGRRTHAGSNGLFTSKETNYGIHVDEAYLDVRLPFTDSFAPSRMHLGREYITLGNKLVLDYELDGVNIVTKWSDTTSTKIGYSIMSEGYMGLSDNKANQYKWDALSEGQGVSGGAARLYFGQLKQKLPEKYGTIEAFLFAYQDDGTDDGTAYLRDDIDYSIARFQPQIGTLFCLGFAGDLNLDGGNITVKYEVDGLWGKDPINNQTYNSNGITQDAAVGAATDPGYIAQHYWNRLDKNDGTINGWNVYADAQLHYWETDYKITPGLIVGAGSGDSNKSGGRGNVNKLMTEGWFYICEVWEDSIMPDLTGITPQGLGSPWSRGYREFENQTLVQLNNSWKFLPKWNFFTSYTYVHANTNIYAWDDEPKNHNRPTTATTAGQTAGQNPNNDYIDSLSATGGYDTSRYSKNLGHEIDARLEYTIFPKLVMEIRGGYFFTGDAASYLIAGAKGWDRDIWEARWDVTFSF